VLSRVLVTKESRYADVCIAWGIAIGIRTFKGATKVALSTPSTDAVVAPPTSSSNNKDNNNINIHNIVNNNGANESNGSTFVDNETAEKIRSISASNNGHVAVHDTQSNGSIEKQSGDNMPLDNQAGLPPPVVSWSTSLARKTKTLAAQYALSSLCWWIIDSNCSTTMTVSLPLYSYSISLMLTVASLKLRLSLSDSYYYFMYL
jgi:hypothetical protein